jgi:hypothetical protein
MMVVALIEPILMELLFLQMMCFEAVVRKLGFDLAT